jgi:hypothetical protein
MPENKQKMSENLSNRTQVYNDGLPPSSLSIPMPPVKPPSGSKTGSSSGGNQEKSGGQANGSN